MATYANAVNDAAAFLFWTLAESLGVSEANNVVAESAGRCLLKQPFTDMILSRYCDSSLPSADRAAFQKAIAIEAERCAVNKANNNGMVYTEDAIRGRSPSAKLVDTSTLKRLPKKIIKNGAGIENVGRLCLRHPLPAVVFSKTAPLEPFVEVADTTDALGFHIPMFLCNFACQQATDDLFILMGIFHIPVPDKRQGDLWNRAIQNSSRFINRMAFISGESTVNINVEW